MKTLKKFFYLARPFWSGAHGRLQWLMLAVLIGFTLFSITISVWIAAWDKRFYDALAAFDGASMPSLIVEYLGYMAMVIGCIVCADWLQKRLIFRWRTHLTEQFQKNWLEGHKHYYENQYSRAANSGSFYGEPRNAVFSLKWKM